jgi:hypothetical protein
MTGALSDRATHDDRTPDRRLRCARPLAAALFSSMDRLCAIARGFAVIDTAHEVRLVSPPPVWSAAHCDALARLEAVEIVLAIYDAPNGDDGLRCPLSPMSGPATLATQPWSERLRAGAEWLDGSGHADGAAVLIRVAEAWERFALGELAAIAGCRDLLSDFHGTKLRAGWVEATIATTRRGRDAFGLADGSGPVEVWPVWALADAIGITRSHCARKLRGLGVRIWTVPKGPIVVDAQRAADRLGFTRHKAEQVGRRIEARARDVRASGHSLAKTR